MSDTKSESQDHGKEAHFRMFALLREAVKVVPAVRVAVGLFGLLSGFIVLVLFRTGPVVAIVGAVGTVGVMFTLVLLGQLGFARPHRMSVAILVGIWTLVLLTVSATSLLFTSVFFDWPIALRNILLPEDPKAVSHEFPTAIAVTVGIAGLLIPLVQYLWQYLQRMAMMKMRLMTTPAERAKVLQTSLRATDPTLERIMDVIKRLEPEKRDLLKKILEGHGDLQNQDGDTVGELLDKFGDVGDEKPVARGDSISDDRVTG